MQKTDIIIPCWNNATFTEKCLESIVKNTRPETYRLILIDNGSSDHTFKVFHDYEEKAECLIIRNPNNFGFAKAVNQGLRLSVESNKDGYKVILNNDTEMPEGWLEKMIAVAESDINIGMVGALSSAFTEPHYYKHAEQIKALTQINRVYFHCVLIKPVVIETIGYLDEEFEYAYCEDDDYCQRAIEMKFKLAYAYEVVVTHHHMASTKRLPNIGEIYEKNLQRLKDKYPYLVQKNQPKKIHIAVPTSSKISPYNNKNVMKALFNPKYRISFDYYIQSPVDVNRNHIVYKFLHESDDEILGLIDNDVVPPNDFIDVVDLNFDVVGISCLNIITGRRGQDAPHIVFCVAEADGNGGYKGLDPSRMNGIQQVERIGFGCVFIKRQVLEVVEPPWFKQSYSAGYELEESEDYYFCDRAIEKGFKVWYDFTRICDHRKDNISLLEVMKLIQRERALAILEYKNRLQNQAKIIRPA